MLTDTSALPAPRGLDGFAAAFSTIDDGNMARSQANRVEVMANRERFLRQSLHGDKTVLRIRPSHGPSIDVVTAECDVRTSRFYPRAPRIVTDFDFYTEAADGALTLSPELAVMLISADCIPVLVWEPRSGLHGILHAGLLGALNGIVLGLPRILADLGIATSDLRCYFGPSISGEKYDISGSGLWQAIAPQVQADQELWASLQPHLRDGKFLDIRGVVGDQLRSIGVPDDHVECFAKSTSDDDSRFYSHYQAQRGAGDNVGFASVIYTA